MSSFPQLHQTDSANEMYSRREDVIKIIPYLKPEWVVWEMCWGRGDFADALIAKGVKVVGRPGMNCFDEEPETYDAIATNPPWRNNKDFLEKAINTNKPFLFLCRLEHMGGCRAYNLFAELEDFAILIPEKRINYITPRMRNGGVAGTAAFHSIWLTRGLNLPQQINYIR